jgi:hypothetical protein
MLRPLLPLVCLLAMCFTAHGEEFRLLSDKPLTRDIREVFVEIQKPLPEAEVRRIAATVKATAKKQYPKTSVWFLLPGMEPGAGAWARALYKPDLELTILGERADSETQKADSEQPEGQVVGTWSVSSPPLPHKIVIVRRGKKTYMVRLDKDGSKSEEEVTEVVADKKFTRRKSKHGEYMLIRPDGHLEFWDKDGKFDAAQKSP